MTPRSPGIGLGAVFLVLFCVTTIPSLADAQQKRILNAREPYVARRQESTRLNVVSGSNPSLSIPLEPRSRDLHKKHTNNNDASSLIDERALATFAPAGRLTPDGDVRAPPARSISSIGGPSSRLPARSLQDWEVEDIVLLATVDGMIHARDRETGTARWSLIVDQPMVETVYYTPNTSHNSAKNEQSQSFTRDFYWIVEPSQDGSLYGYTPGSPFGMQKLGLTVKELAEVSPYAADDPPVVYTAEKKNTLYKVDAGSGRILNEFSPGGSSVYDQGVCRQAGALDALDDDECGPIGTLILGRTEYTIGIQSVTGEPICTIKYTEWGPNNRDKDLSNQYSATKDHKYIYSLYDGRVMALDHFGNKHSQGDFAQKPMYKHKFESPVVRVFDVARPIHSTSRDTPLIILPQPVGPALSDDTIFRDDSRVFVNCTTAGSWYALSETEYPMVTDGAMPAQCSRDDWIYNLPLLGGSEEDQLKRALVGVHALSYADVGTPLIGPDDGLGYPLNGNPPQDGASGNATPMRIGSLAQSKTTDLGTFLQSFLAVLAICLAVLATARWKFPACIPPSQLTQPLFEPSPAPAPAPAPASGETSEYAEFTTSSLVEIVDIRMEAQEPNLLDTMSKTVRFEEKPEEDVSPAPTLPVNAIPGPIASTAKLATPDASPNEVPQKVKKKAHRGQRGGKREAERRKGRLGYDEADAIDGIVEGVKQMGQDVTVTPDGVSASSASVSNGSLGLHNLTFSTDKVLGTGSGGTIVYEGKFEGRDVAVKRMLTVHYELASQEVSLLEQSEDHPNVIRYFCRREDRHFLYIALELCQASLFDLFKDNRNDAFVTPDPKHENLIAEINQAPNLVLRQLAEGIKHLHALRIVHRDIKPQNMLVAYPKKNSVNSFPRLIISDFGLCKTLPEGASTLVGATVNAGTTGWKAPELISQPRDASGANGSHNSVSNSSATGEPQPGAPGVKRAVDIFSLGCVFFYVLTRGLHPFDDEEGWMALRERNIKTNRCNLSAIEIHGPDTVDLIRWMLAPKPEDRPTAAEVLAHPFFWNAEDRLEFLSLVSDRFDMESRDGTSYPLTELELQAEKIIGLGPATLTVSSSPRSQAWSYAQHHRTSPSGYSDTSNAVALPVPEPNFLAMLDKKFTDTLGKQRKYNGARLADLLRALRNKHHHWDDMPDDVKQKVGEVPDGYLRYWEQKFPGLVVGVWRTVRGLGMGEERRFWRWFGGRGG